jgi:hypothetical protein
MECLFDISARCRFWAILSRHQLDVTLWPERADQSMFRYDAEVARSNIVSDFFESPPCEPSHVLESSSARLPWHGPPSGTLPGIVPLDRVLARTEKAAVCLTTVAAYASGFQIDVLVILEDEGAEVDVFGFFRRVRRTAGIPSDMMRFGIQFADGAKVTNTDQRTDLEGRPAGGEPLGPVMMSCEGRSGGGNWEQAYWIWPLPPSGPLVFVCEWPEYGVELTRWEMDAQEILDAAARAKVIFPRAQLSSDDG